MQKPRNLTRAESFFWQHAGYSFAPLAETREQGRANCARNLAAAEAEASSRGYSHEWQVDDRDSSEWSDEQPAWELWVCFCRDESGNCLASLGGVDFGRNGSPWSSNYRRVVEAELSAEAIASTTDPAAAE